MKASKYPWLSLGIFFAALGLMLFFTSACKKNAAEKARIENKQRLDWGLKTTVQAYEQAGHTNPKWDEPAKRALTEFSRMRAKSIGAASFIISDNASAAVKAGCDDPMVNYLFIKFAMDQDKSKEAFTTAFHKAASDMQGSSYPPIRKFYAGLRAIQQYLWANNYPTNWPDEWGALQGQTINQFLAAIDDKEAPAMEIYEASHELLDYEASNHQEYRRIWGIIEPIVLKQWPDAYSSWLLKGEANVKLAWIERGGGYANTVTDEGWKGFKEHLAVAESSLERAWKMDSHDTRIPIEMMTVILGQGGGRDQMESWFQRAMQVDTNCYDACYQKLYYLEPKWHGSREDLLAFGRECAQSTKWGGHVPLILLDAHIKINNYNDRDERMNYWKQPDVWPDLKSAFDRFFELNPDEVSWHHNYAWYAYACGQWDEFLRQTALFSEGTDYRYFGGKDEFDKIVQLAKEHASTPK